MSDTPTTLEEVLKSLSKGLIKEYIVYDGNDRPSEIYQAPTNTLHGKPCLKTSYVYVSPTSSLVLKRKESYDVWDNSYEI